MMTSGTSGGLTLAMLSFVNPGDEVIVFDPCFVAYAKLIALAGGRMVAIDTYPDFDVDPDKVKAALSPRTKLILVNSPANPTGKVIARERLRDLALLAAQHGILLLSDEVYRVFTYDVPFSSPAEFNEDVLVLDGFSKSHGMTGWRLGFAHGPRRLIDEMTKLMQFTYVCPPSIAQYAGVAACDVDMSHIVAEYRRKRDRIWNGLRQRYDVVKPEGAFYIFPACPMAPARNSLPRRCSTSCCRFRAGPSAAATRIFASAMLSATALSTGHWRSWTGWPGVRRRAGSLACPVIGGQASCLSHGGLLRT